MIEEDETDAFIDELDTHYTPFKSLGFWAVVLCIALVTYLVTG